MPRKLCLLARGKRSFRQLLYYRVHAFSKSQQQRTEAAAWPGIGVKRHTDVPRGESDRMSDRAEEPIPGRAVAPA
ncbi:hypothetical protein, partial [Xanthomonas hortorum]|uniref:hypothetical protein n=1 Tax=Xanthomonas hortorum TaxID=56454 RepID=UPI001C3C8932